MGTVLLTVAHGGRRRDLAARADVPIADLLPSLAEALAATAPPARRLSTAHRAATAHGLDPADAQRRGGAPREGDPSTVGRPGGPVGHGLVLAPVGGQPLPVERSLEACGVGHGAVLVLIDGDPDATNPGARASRGTSPHGTSAGAPRRGGRPWAGGSWSGG
jgi:hypothetical protein